MIRRELIFLLALWKANLLAVMEYRIAFLSQVAGMALNNGIYFLFWVIFFDRFEQIRGWGLQEMFLLFGVVAVGIGLANFLFGNLLSISEVVAEGRLDYYLSLPRSVLLHLLASNAIASGAGDFVYGLLSFAAARLYTLDAIARFVVASLMAGLVFLSVLTLVQSAVFWVGRANMLASVAMNALITFSLYPITLFDGTAKLLLLTLLPAAFIGAVPAEFVRSFTWTNLGMMLLATTLFTLLATLAFHRGLRRYESGSAIQVRM